MADITLCKGGRCPLKETCYRYIGTPEPVHQKYFVNPPYLLKGKNKEAVCGYHWQIHDSE